jgi:hypothetical protein
MSGLKQFDFQSIDQIDNGSLVVALNNAIHQAYLDCESRPALGKSRDVTLKVSLKPIVEGTRLYRVEVSFDVKKSFPSQGLGVMMKPGDDGLEFQPEVPDNPNQNVLPYDSDK